MKRGTLDTCNILGQDFGEDEVCLLDYAVTIHEPMSDGN